MPLRNGQVVSFYPTGVVDSANETSSFPGSCAALQNVVFDRLNRGAVIARPGVTQALSTAGFISASIAVGTRIYGMYAGTLYAGHDQPFCYDTSTSSLVALTGIVTGASTNLPTSPSTTGAWTPPTMDVVGTKIIVTHPGFSGSNYFGWFDIGGFSLSTTGTTTSGNNTLTAVGSTTGVLNGMTVTGTGIPVNTYVLSTTSNTIVLSNNATANGAGVSITITGGTNASPAWGAGNTATNGLPSVPLWVCQFFNRAYFGCGNAVYFTDSLNPNNISGTNFAGALTLGDTSNTTGAAGLAFSTSSAGILSSLAVFKANSIYQISGDITGAAGSSYALSLNIISANIGCSMPRTAVSTPDGIYFIAADGPRLIDLRGQLQWIKPDGQVSPDVVLPFTNCTQPSRACGGYTNGVYRVCLDTRIGGYAFSGIDYWYDTIFGRWNGPHTFSYSGAVSVGGVFYLNSDPRLTPSLYRSEVTPSSTTVYTDNSVAVTSAVQSSAEIIPSDMNETCLIETTCELGNNDNNAGTYLVTAADDTGAIINQVSVNAPYFPPYPHILNFGYQALVIPTKVTQVPWTSPLVFKKMVFAISATSSSGFSVRETKHRFQKLGYLTS